MSLDAGATTTVRLLYERTCTVILLMSCSRARRHGRAGDLTALPVVTVMSSEPRTSCSASRARWSSTTSPLEKSYVVAYPLLVVVLVMEALDQLQVGPRLRQLEGDAEERRRSSRGSRATSPTRRRPPRRRGGRRRVEAQTDVWVKSSGNCTMASARDVRSSTSIVADTRRTDRWTPSRARWPNAAEPVESERVLGIPEVRVGGREHDTHERECEGQERRARSA